MKKIARISSCFSLSGSGQNKTDSNAIALSSVKSNKLISLPFLLFFKTLQFLAALSIVLTLSACGGSSSDSGSSDATTYTVGGSVSGLNGTLVLQNNAEDDLTITLNGSFEFATSVKDESTYKVTVLTQPVEQTCSITNGQGTVSGANITHVAVDCVTNIDTTPPSIPGTPTDTGVYSLSTTVTFNWTAATDDESGIASYNLQAGSIVGSSDIFDGNVGNVVSYNVTGTNGQTLFARVQAINGEGLTGDWSGSSNGITIDTVPPVVSITSPMDGGTISGSVNVSADALDNVAMNRVEFSIDGTGLVTVMSTPYEFSLNTTTLTNATHTISATAYDRVGLTSTDSISITVDNTVVVLPPDPADVATEIDPTVAMNFATVTEFLYTGSAPIQTGVADGTMQALHVAVLRGMVKERDGSPISGVVVSILNHPEFGQTLSRVDGMFDMAVNGGELLTVSYQKSDYLIVQRQLDVPWRDYARLPDVVMIPVDTRVTTIDLTSGSLMQVAMGNEVTDSDGTRRAVLMIPQGTSAEMVLPDGSTQSISTLSIRATEYTVGDSGLEAMPAVLPPASQYTYAFELSADEALAIGATDVRFNQPLYYYVENFIGFPVGGAVPTGYYDKQLGQWVASKNGRVINILSITNSLADLDTDGDDVVNDAATLALLGITSAEREQLATLYGAGQQLWRVPMTHFTPWDCNWPYGPPPDSDYPNQPVPDTREPAKDEEDESRCDNEGSIIECQNRVLGQRLPVTGTPLTLNYRSDRVEGVTEAYTARISLTGDTYPPSLKDIGLRIRVAGQQLSESFAPGPNLSYLLGWDGLDVWGRKVQGSVTTAHVTITYVYDAYYYPIPSDLEQSFGEPSPDVSGEVIPARDLGLVYLVQRFTVQLYPFDMRERNGLGGWSLNSHHSYDPNGQVLELGDGSTRSIASFNGNVIDIVAGTGVAGYSGDGGPAIEAQLNNPYAIAFRPDGSFYFADGLNHIIRFVDLDGTITTVAGNGNYGYSGDGGPATEAQLYTPLGIAIAPDGSLYIGDRNNYRVRRVGPDGIITTIAGNGDPGYSGDGGPATEAQLYEPTGIAIASDGSFYIGDRNNRRIRRVKTNGIISTVAGDGTYGSSGDGGLATAAQLRSPERIALGPDGSLYISDRNSHNVRRVGTDGIITTVAGNGTLGYSGDGGLATEARFNYPGGIAISPDGKLYIADIVNNRVRMVNQNGIINTIAGGGDAENYDWATQVLLNLPQTVTLGPNGKIYVSDTYNHKIRRISPPLPGVSEDDIFVPSADGSQVYHFNENGRHLRTLNSLTGTVLYQFDYDASGYLINIEDGDGNITTIERYGDGSPLAIVGPYGQRTNFTLDANGYLATVSDPEGNSYVYQYTSDGLLSQETDPEGNVSAYTYDDTGRLQKAEDPAGGFKEFVRTDTEYGYEVAVTTAEGRTTTYWVGNLPTGEKNLINTFPNGLSNVTLIGTDGTRTNTYTDGTVMTQQIGPDPRWGMQAPVIENLTISTPGGVTYTATNQRVATLTNPQDPLSLETLATTLNINGNDYVSVYDVATNTLTSTTPEGRQDIIVFDETAAVVQLQRGDLLPFTFAYDGNGRLISISQGSGADTRITTFDYDFAGYTQSITDPLDQNISYAYDAAGRLQTTTRPDGSEIAFTVDANGSMTGLTPPEGAEHTFVYTSLDILSTYNPPDIGLAEDRTQYVYNSDRQTSLVTYPDSQTLTYGYDTAGRLDSLTLPRGDTLYAYDPATGKAASIESPDGITLTYTYDGLLFTDEVWSGPVSGSVSYDFDSRFYINATQINGANEISFSSDADDRLIQAGDLTVTRDAQTAFPTATMLGNVTTARGYNGFGELDSYGAAYNSTAIFAVQYGRDNLGRIIDKTETVNSVTSTYDYDYDTVGGLIQVDRDSITIASYAYDNNGNRTSYTDENGIVTGTSYDAQDRLTGYGSATYSYTANGELLGKIDGNDTTVYDYGVLGSLLTVTLPDSTQIDYLNDGVGRRVGKKVNNVLVQGFLYKNHKIMAELDGANQLVNRFVYALGSNVPEYMIRSGVIYRIISDHLHSPRLVVNSATGEVVQRMNYDAFGTIIEDTNPGFQPFGFAGGLYDQDTRLTRFGLRDYDAETGRWTARDPIRFAGGDTNLYAYVSNDPVNATDPTGLKEKCTATVAYVKGDIDITPAACGEGFQPTIVGPIEEGFTVKPGDEVVTGEKSRIKILTSDGSLILLGSGKKLLLTPELLGCLPGSEMPLGIGTKIGAAVRRGNNWFHYDLLGLEPPPPPPSVTVPDVRG